jgi:hypothetical protein
MRDRVDIANRHLLPANGLADAADPKALSVRIVVNDNWGASIAGQLLVSCLVNLLCRQAKLVTRVEIVARNTPTVIHLPSGTLSTPFPLCLQTLAVWAVKGAVAVSARQTDAAVDYTIVVGGVDMMPYVSSPGHELFVLGDGWRAWLGERRHAPCSSQPHFTNPLGPFFAATLTAGEIFKRSRGILRGRYLVAAGFSLWSGQSSEDWNSLDNGPELEGRTLPPIHVIGVGAVGNGLAYIIANSRFNDAYLVLIDDDSYDDTNLNRCLMAGWHDVGEPKVEAVARGLREAGVGTFPFPGSIKDYSTASRAGLRKDVTAEADELKFNIVVSCVDKNTSRHDVQGLWPRSLLGGSTLDLTAKTNVYGLRPGAACLACHNPKEQDGEKIRTLEARLRNMPVDEREHFLSRHGLNMLAIEEYLTNPKCGSLGETALKDFATRSSGEFSVGFVSLGAALLLSSSLFRHALFAGKAPKRGDMTTLNFLNDGTMDSGLGVDDHCQRCSDTRRQK